MSAEDRRSKLEHDKGISEIKICVPVIGTTTDEFLLNLRRAQEISNLVELRVDFIEDLTSQDILRIRNDMYGESVFTCRRSSEEGRFKGSEEERVAIIKEALLLDFDHVDIELATLQEHPIDFSNRGKTKIIVSHHNFEETPEEDTLREIIRTMKEYDPDIVKVVTQIDKPEDNDTLFRLMLDKSLDLPKIIIGMGKLGEITRIVGPLLGGYLTFASTDGLITAQGQIDINRLRQIYKLIAVQN